MDALPYYNIIYTNSLISGSLYDLTESYDPGFCLAGVAIALSGLILFLIPPMQRWRLRKSGESPKKSSAEDI